MVTTGGGAGSFPALVLAVGLEAEEGDAALPDDAAAAAGAAISSGRRRVMDLGDCAATSTLHQLTGALFTCSVLKLLVLVFWW